MTPENALRSLTRGHPARMFSPQAVQRRTQGSSLATTRVRLRKMVQERRARAVQLPDSTWVYRAV